MKEKTVKLYKKRFTTLCNEGVRISNRKVSEFFKNGQKKCPKKNISDILCKSRDFAAYFKIKVRTQKK